MKRTNTTEQMNNYPDIKQAASGRWLEIISSLAPELAEACSKPGKHVACPCHGNKDGFRMFYDAAENFFRPSILNSAHTSMVQFPRIFCVT